MDDQQKKDLANVLEHELSALPGIKKCHWQCDTAAKILAILHMDDVTKSYMVMISWQDSLIHKQAFAGISTTSSLDILLKRGTEELGLQLETHRQTTMQLMVQLEKAQNDQERSRLLDEITTRHSEEIIPSLGKVLRQEMSPAIFAKALGALIELNSPKAAEEIIANSRQKSPEYLIQIIYALEQIPCDISDNYLDTLAGGHPNQKVRTAAKTVLENRQRRAHANSATEE